MSKVIYEGWMVRYGRRKIGRSFIHMRYFVLETRVLAYYKRKPQDNQVPIKTLLIDGNCRVEDRGLKMHHGHMVYVLCVYNKKEKHHRVTMAAFNIQEALIWKEKIELVIDQQGSLTANGNKVYASFQYKSGIENGRKSSSSDQESQCSPEDEEESQRTLLRRTTIGNGLPESVLDWTREHDSGIADQSASDQVFSRKHWRLVRCQNGLRIFEELVEVDYLPRSCSRAMKAVGVVEASCEAVFELVMGMDGTRFEWDCSFQYGSLVEEVDGHTAILYHRLQLDWFSIFVWPRDLCYVRYWRRNDDGSYVVLFRSRDHPSCGLQPGFVRAHIESGGFNISPLKSRNGRPRTQVEHLMQIDLKGWGVGYVPSFQQHCLLQMLNTVAGLREWFSQTDESNTVPRLPVMANMTTASVSSKKEMKTQETSIRPTPSLDQLHSASRNSVMLDEDSDEDDDYQIPESEQEGYSVKLGNDIKRIAINEESSDQIGVKRTALNEESSDQFDLSCFSGNLRRDDRDKTRDCWRISDASNFRVHSKHFAYDKTKIPAGKPLMELVAVDWFKDVKRMDHVAGRQGCAVQLDENSRLVLKKLLDGATNQALQSQAKIVCNKPSPKPEIKEAKIPTDKEADSSEKFQKCNLVAANQVLNTGKEHAANEANPSQAEKQLDLKNSGQIPNLAFNRGRDLTLARQNSLKSTTSHRHHHHHREPKPREPKVRTNNSATKAIGIIQDQRVSTKPVPNYDLFAIVPAEKRARIEKITTGSLALPPPISSIPRTRIVGQADRDLTHSKRHEPGLNTLTLFTGAPPSKPLSRMGSLKVKDIGRNKCGDGPSKALSRMASLEGKDRGRNRSGDKPSKPPSRTGSFKWKDRGRNSSVEGSAGSNKPGSLNGKDRGRNSSVEGSVGSNMPEKRWNQEPNKYNRRPTVVGARPPRIPATLKSVGYESMSEPTSDSTGSSSVSRRSRRVVPSRRKQQPGVVEEKPPSKILTSQRTVRPTRPKKQPTPPRPTEKRREGQLKRFKNKLAIIFHHHHHHHIHDGHMDTVVKHGGTHVTNEKHHRSPWMYLRSLLHHTSGEDPGRNNSKKLAKASGRAVGQQQHGYFYALLEGLVRHVWGMSRQKKARARHNQLGKAGSRRGSKRLQYWWQRFRRRRGLKLGNKKMPRFRLGFKRSHSGTNRNRA